MNALFTHVWTSTLVLAAALLAARLLPLTACTRYAVVMAGLVKFALPSIALTTPLRLVGLDPARLVDRPVPFISIEWFGGALNVAAAPAAATAIDWRTMLLAVWIASSSILACVWLVARRRLVAAALTTSTEASPRERRLLAAARQRLGLRASVEIRRSTICEAPAVVRILRPVIVLPEHACESLDDAELESVLRHECAHVARRDNLAGVVESAIVAAFWFHPLVWLAQRVLATAREEACDEMAAAAGSEALDANARADALAVYASALTKICRAVLAPRLAGVSCMASAQLDERLRHLMNFESLRRRALSHRFVTTFAAASVIAVAVACGLGAAPITDRYSLHWYAQPERDAVGFRGRVMDRTTGRIVAMPNVSFGRGMGATVEHNVAGEAARTLRLIVREEGRRVHVEMTVLEDGQTVQVSAYSAPIGRRAVARNAQGRRYTGEAISIHLRDADIKDVLNLFATLTTTRIEYSPSLAGDVTVDITDVPWDQAFDIVLAQNGLTYEIRDGVIVVK